MDKKLKEEASLEEENTRERGGGGRGVGMTTTMVVVEATKARCSGDDDSGRMVVEAKMAGW